MSPHYHRPTSVSGSTLQTEFGGGPDDDAMVDAAEALRHAEVEAVQPELSPPNSEQALESMSIDELRKLAAKLDVPNRGAITDQNELIAAIRERM